MLKINNKKASHVGVVLSFILFITFIVFMYVLLDSKVNQERGKPSTLNYVKGTLLEQVSAELTTVSVALISPQSNCVELSGFLSGTGLSNRIIVRDDSGNVLTSGISGQNLKVERNGNTFFRVYESETFSPEGDLSSSCQSPSYTIGLSKTENLIFESKVAELSVNYAADYEALKRSLNIGSGDEFGFVLTYNDETMLKTPEENVTISIYASQIPIQYIRTNGAREAGILTVLVW